MRRGGRIVAPLAAAALALTGCGGIRPGDRISGTALTIYFSGPMRGASSAAARAALSGARLALAAAHGRVGNYRIALRALDDSTSQSDGWDPNQTTLNARLATADPTTIGYIGEFNSGASAISIPLLNRDAIAQVSPGATAVGLTTAGTGAAPGEPQKYYPLGTRTFARVVPTDAVQARALVAVQRTFGCASTFVLHDGEVDGEDTALTFLLTAQSAALRVVGVQTFPRHARSYGPLVAAVARSGADCVLVSAIDERSAALLTADLARTLPGATIFAANALADSSYLDPARGGISVSVGGRVIVVSATLGARAYPSAGQTVLARYARAAAPTEPSTVYGYQAMEVMLRAISWATDQGRMPADRSKVAAGILRTKVIESPFGAFRIGRHGDSTVSRYGIYRVAAGRLSYVQAAG